ncbi:MAG: UDP-glucose/GDP-mannose dehydrogenase family protein [Acidobacteria bacterium]|nr:UDP-glucose/GDP-mannose dehydrogenase family protein [Acidobacteriota bacterium]
MSKVAVVGIWHQGAVLSACLADMGHRVAGFLPELDQVERMNRGMAPVFEPGLAALIRKNRRAGRLLYTHDEKCLRDVHFIFISHDTPVDESDESDLSCVMESVELVRKVRKKPAIVCITAQVPVGTCDRIEKSLRASLGPRTYVLYIPEFLRLGTAIQLFRSPDRVVIGGEKQAARKAARLYEPLKCPILITERRSAEMAKHSSNAFLAASISFINEISDLCEATGADATEVAKVMKMDRRIGKHAFLSPGLGFAGGTLGREIRALQKLAKGFGRESVMMDAVWRINQARPAVLVNRLEEALGSLSGKKIAILGLTYKSGTSTMRRAISLEIIRALRQGGATVAAYDPLANLDEVRVNFNLERVNTPEDAFTGADAVVLLTEWEGMKRVNWKAARKRMRGAVLFDTRNLLDLEMLRKAGFDCFRIGNGAS